MPYVRLSAEEKARRKAMRDEAKAQRQAMGRIPSQKQIEKELQKARLQILKTQEQQRVRMAKQELLAQKKALKDAREQAKNNRKYNIATKRAIAQEVRQEMRQARVNMRPAEKSVMNSKFIGALLPTQSRRITKAQQLKEERRVRREGIVANMMARRALVAPAPVPVPVPVAPAPAPVPVAPARRGRGRPRLNP
jgi:hypothetical protein